MGSMANRNRVLIAALLLVSGCGSTGGDNQCNSRDPSGPAPCAAASRTCYVHPFGSDNNDGSGPELNRAFRSINRAIEVVQDNYTIRVSPGTYLGGITTDRLGRCAPQALALIGESTNSPVVINALNAEGRAGIRVSNGDNSLIEGFTIINSPGPGILINSGSDGVQIGNNIIRDNASDGIRVQDSADVLVFNNLIYANNGIGVALVGSGGSPRGRVISNTIAFNARRGIEIGRSDGASPGARTRNNIVQSNGTAQAGIENIKVFDNSIPGYDGDFNLVFPPTYVRVTVAGPRDVQVDARFDAAGAAADPAGFRLRSTSPAINNGGTDFGLSSASLVQLLIGRTTVASNAPDQLPLDIGFHFPIPN